MFQTSEIIVKIPRCWKFGSVLGFLKAMSLYTSTSSDCLCVNQIYDLQFAKAKLNDIEIFGHLNPEELVSWVEFTHYGTLTGAKTKFIAWLDLNITNLETNCHNMGLDQNQITIGDFWKAKDLQNYKMALITEIAKIEDIPIAYEKTKEAERQLAKEREEQRLKILEIAKAKRLEEAQNKEKAESEWISAKKQYYLRCKHYLQSGYDHQDGIESDDLYESDMDEMKSVISQAHQKKNDELVKYKTFPGCHYFGLGCDCDDENCYWTVDMYRCSCDNYKGFTFNTEDVNWLEDLSLDSHSPRGHQDRQW